MEKTPYPACIHGTTAAFVDLGMSGLAGDELAEGFGDAAEDAVPVAERFLAEEAVMGRWGESSRPNFIGRGF